MGRGTYISSIHFTQLMKKLLKTIFVLLFVFQLPAQTHHDRLANIDVQHYQFGIEIFDESDKIKGRADVSVLFKNAVQSFELDLVKLNAEGKGMTIISLSENAKPCQYNHAQSHLQIIPNTAIQKDEIRTYTIEYEGIPTDGLIIAKNQFGSRGFFGDNWPNRAHHWLPTVDHPSDKAKVEFLITAPLHFQVVANGRQVEESNLGNGKRLNPLEH